MPRPKFVPLSTFPATCSHCGKDNAECVGYKKKSFFFFETEQYICQTCISRAFRSFKKGK